jgi:hypothetical protein
MPQQWTRHARILRVKVKTVELRRRLTGQFQVEWARQEPLGRTELARPDPARRLVLDTAFELRCTFYVSPRGDGGEVFVRTMGTGEARGWRRGIAMASM